MYRSYHATLRYVLCILLLMTAVALNATAGKYDDLLQKASAWSDERIMQEADTFLQRGDQGRAMVLYMMETKRSHNNPTSQQLRLTLQAHINAGKIYYDGGNYANALNFYLKGLKISESTDEKPFIGVFYKNMGNVYCMFQDYEKGLSLYVKGLKLARGQYDDDTAYKILQNLTGVNINLGNVADARKYYEEAQRTRHEVTDVSRFMDEYTLALIVRDEGHAMQSIRMFRKLAAKARDMNIGARYECSAYEEISLTYNSLHQTDSTITYLGLCRDLAERSGLIHEFVETLNKLSSLHEERGETGLAMKYRTRYWHVRDSVYNQRKFDAAKNQQFLYEMEKTEREIARLAEEQERRAQIISRQQQIIGCTVAGILIALLILLYVFRQNRRLKESYRSLYSLTRRLAENHRQAMEREQQLDGENDSLRRQLEQMHKDAEGQPKASVNTENTPESEGMKYKSSNLRDESRNRIARQIAAVMEEGAVFCSPEFSLETLAACVSSNSKYVSQAINEVYGKNFSNYVNEYRISLACARLADTEHYGHYSIKGIGESVGFRSHSTFISVFRKNTGMTPSIYQKMTREELQKQGTNA